MDARRALIDIEKNWNVPIGSAIYSLHGEVARDPFNVFQNADPRTGVSHHLSALILIFVK